MHTPAASAHSERNGTQNAFHHRQVLPVVVRLEESDAQIQFEEDASDAPHITGLIPAQLQNYFWSTIVTS